MRTHQRSFSESLGRHLRGLDLLGLLAPVLVVAGVHGLGEGTREALAFDTTQPTVLTAYTSHFVHLTDVHALGNLAVYLPAVSVTYLLCVLSGRRRLFWTAFATVLVAFPFALSGLQLLFPRERLLLGASGLTAGIVGIAAFALVGYVRTTIAPGLDDEYAPAVLFFTAGLTALIALPARAWRLEIGLGALAVCGAYLGVALSRQGLPDRRATQAALDRPGYVETAGAGVGLLVGYPFVAFQEAVVPGDAVVDVYVHLLGFALGFIVVFAFVFLQQAIDRQSMTS